MYVCIVMMMTIVAMARLVVQSVDNSSSQNIV